MVSVEARAAPLIESYVRDITPDLYGAFWQRKRIVEELSDHLMEAAERFHAHGIAWAEAQEQAVDQFGSPHLVARTFAQSKGVGVPTTFTRYSGLAGIVGSLILMVAFIWQEFSESFMHGAFAEVALMGGALFAIGLVGMYVRCRGQLGKWGRVGFRMIFIGLVMGFVSSVTWYAPIALMALPVLLFGLISYLVAMLKSDVLPKLPLITILVGVVVTLVAGLISSRLDYDTGPIGMVVVTGTAAIGLVGIGRFMWAEQPVDRTEWSDPARPA